MVTIIPVVLDKSASHKQLLVVPVHSTHQYIDSAKTLANFITMYHIIAYSTDIFQVFILSSSPFAVIIL